MAGKSGTNAAQLSEAVFNAINAHDPSRMTALMADDVVAWDPTIPTPLKGKQAVEQYFRAQFKTFPDAHVKVLSHIESQDGNTVATEMEWSGTQKGAIEMPGQPSIPPTNRKVTGKGVIVGRAKNGKVTSFSVYYDTGSMMQQLGLAGAPK